MNSNLVMKYAAIILCLVGITCLFIPKEILTIFNATSDDVQGLIVQLLGAAFLGFAALDWASRQSLLGGIYGRPVVSANQVHFVIGSLLTAKAAMSQPNYIVLWLTLSVYALFAIAFSVILYGPPPKKETIPTT